ncbi:hypothetical protein K8Q93_00965 [Candidatus Parcubacteria bacterium]|nr:hypothetical protein [Candidatus Parcubacteria bacterium]
MIAAIKKDLLKSLGIDKLTSAEQENILERISNLIFQGVLTRAMQELSIEERATLDKVLKAQEKDPDSDTLYLYLKEKIPHLDEVVEEEIEEFKEEFIGTMKALS